MQGQIAHCYILPKGGKINLEPIPPPLDESYEKPDATMRDPTPSARDPLRPQFSITGTNEDERMASVNEHLRESLVNLCEGKMFVAPDIDEKRLNNAVSSFGYDGDPSNVIALLDVTLLGSGKDGMLFTGERLFYKEAFSEVVVIPFQDVNAFALSEVAEGDKSEPVIQTTLKDGGVVRLKGESGCNHSRLVEVLNHAITEFDEFIDSQQQVPLEQMTEAVKVAYIKAVINMAFDDDGEVDQDELAEILLLMTRISLSKESRFEIRGYMVSVDELASLESLLGVIRDECPEGQEKSLHLSLVKDLINIFFVKGGESVTGFEFLQKHRTHLMVTDEQIELAVMVIENDRKLLQSDASDDQVIASIKALSAKAAAVGVPLGAVYLSGSVVGMSAVGMTSGLATLGMGGLLGLSSMATGIGVIVLLGVGAYAGVRKITGADELSHIKRRELMLNDVIKQTQETIILVMGDVNYVVEKLNTAIDKHGELSSGIQGLRTMLSQLTRAGTVLGNKADASRANQAKLRCARFLDEKKLGSLTREPTKRKVGEYIRSFYEPRQVKLTKDDVTEQVEKLVIKSDTALPDLEDLGAAFEAIGYFKVSSVVKGAAGDVADKAGAVKDVAGDKLGQAADAMKDAAGEATDKAAEMAELAKSKAKEKFGRFFS